MLIFMIALPLLAQSQDSSLTYFEHLERHRLEMNQEFADPEESPLTKEALDTFTALPFYPVDSQYCVKARFIRTKGEKPFEMPTTTDRKAIYEKYAEAHFEIKGQPLVLNIYQSHRLRAMEEHKNHLFLPFKDWTNGNGSYGGGRFMDLKIPEGDTIILDFNKAYNPYCAYNDRYSCPIPPRENHLEIAIEAGVKAYH